MECTLKKLMFTTIKYAFNNQHHHKNWINFMVLFFNFFTRNFNVGNNLSLHKTKKIK